MIYECSIIAPKSSQSASVHMSDACTPVSSTVHIVHALWPHISSACSRPELSCSAEALADPDTSQVGPPTGAGVLPADLHPGRRLCLILSVEKNQHRASGVSRWKCKRYTKPASYRVMFLLGSLCCWAMIFCGLISWLKTHQRCG